MNATIVPEITEPLVLDSYVVDFFLTEEEIDDRLKEFAEHVEKLDKSLTEDEEVENFGLFFGAVETALSSVGTFSEGGLDEETDFTSNRDVDPSHVLRVRAVVPITKEVVNVLLDSFASLDSDYAIIFVKTSGRSVLFSSGEFLHEEE